MRAFLCLRFDAGFFVPAICGGEGNRCYLLGRGRAMPVPASGVGLGTQVKGNGCYLLGGGESECGLDARSL